MTASNRIRLLSIFSIVCVCAIGGLAYYNWQLSKQLLQQSAVTQTPSNGIPVDPFFDQSQAWDPMQQFQQMQQQMNQMLHSAFASGTVPQSSMTMGQRAQVEFEDEGKQYEVIVHVPDHQQAEVHSRIEGDRLSVSGKISNQKSSSNDGFHSSMTSISQFSESFYLPDAVNEADMVTRQDGNDIKIILPKA